MSQYITIVADEEGFEPSEDLHRRRFSRPVHSTALPPILTFYNDKTLAYKINNNFNIVALPTPHLTTHPPFISLISTIFIYTTFIITYYNILMHNN